MRCAERDQIRAAINERYILLHERVHEATHVATSYPDQKDYFQKLMRHCEILRAEIQGLEEALRLHAGIHGCR